MAEEVVAPWVPEGSTLVVFRIKKEINNRNYRCFAAGIIAEANIKAIKERMCPTIEHMEKLFEQKCSAYVFLRGKTLGNSLGLTDEVRWYLHTPSYLDDWVVTDGFRRLQKVYEKHRKNMEQTLEIETSGDDKFRHYTGVYSIADRPYQMELEN